MTKKIFSILLIISIITSFSAFVFAEDSALTDGIFTYELSGDNATITCVQDVDGKVIIPDKIDGHRVTAIGDGAFGGSTRITEVYIPDSVYSIGSMCFAYSTSIKSVRLSTKISVINDGLFYQCDALMGVTVPYGVTTISSKAFGMCKNLVAVTIPNSARIIADDAFTGSDYVTLHCRLDENGTGYKYAQAKNMPAEELITVYVNGEEIVFDQPPVTEKKRFRTLVPLRAVLEKMGAEIEWYNDMNYAGIDIDGNRLLIKPGESFMMVNGKAKTLSCPAMEYNNRVLLPIRDVVESVGGKISWNEFDKVVTVTYNK